MLYQRIRGLMIVGSVAIALLATPTESKACAFFDCLFGRSAGAAYAPPAYSMPVAPQMYAPTYAPQCSPCVPQTCQYVPQTCYRTVYQNVPVTTYRPMVGQDPCTGCPVTSYLPVTAVMRQTQLVPYTTYRVVYANPVAQCGVSSSCSTCGPAGCAAYGSAVSGSGCSSCQTGTAVSSATPYYDSAPATVPTPAPATAPASATPSLENTPAQKTFQQESQKAVEQPITPIPQSGATLNSTSTPTLIDPDNHTTWRTVRPISYEAPVDDGGWRASTN